MIAQAGQSIAEIQLSQLWRSVEQQMEHQPKSESQVVMQQKVEQGCRPWKSGERFLVPYLVFPMKIPLPAGDLYHHLVMCSLGAM